MPVNVSTHTGQCTGGVAMLDMGVLNMCNAI